MNSPTPTPRAGVVEDGLSANGSGSWGQRRRSDSVLAHPKSKKVMPARAITGYTAGRHGRRVSILLEPPEPVQLERQPSCYARSRHRVGCLMNNVVMEVFIMILVVIYAVLVLFDLSIENDLRDKIAAELRVIDMSLLSLFALELLLKTFAFGCSFYRNSWNTFDAIVIVVSLIMGIVEAFLSSLVILRILRLRSVLRLFRLMVLVGKVKQTHDTLHTLRNRQRSRHNNESPLERVLYSLHELSKLDLAPAHKESIEYILEVLTTNQLYKPGAPDLNSGSSMDNETNNWLQAQWLPTSAHSGKRKRDMIVEDDERAAMEQLLRKVSSDSVPTIAASGGAGAGAGFGAGPRSGQSPLAYEKQLAAAKTASFTARVKQHAKGGFAAKVAQLSAASDSATLRAQRRRKGATTNTGTRRGITQRTSVYGEPGVLGFSHDVSGHMMASDARYSLAAEASASAGESPSMGGSSGAPQAPTPAPGRVDVLHGGIAAGGLYSNPYANLGGSAASASTRHQVGVGGGGQLLEGTAREEGADVLQEEDEGEQDGALDAHANKLRVLGKMRGLTLRCLQLSRLLETIDEWTFNILDANAISDGAPLFLVTFNLLDLHGVTSAFDLDLDVLRSLMYEIEAGYKQNPYHNSLHAADVTQTISWFISRPFLLPYVTSLEKFAAIMAAAVHDFRHPGVSNAFEISAGTDLALRYNDRAVLENMHAAEFFKLLKHDDLNVCANFERDTLRTFRSTVIQMVLGTDMAQHFEELAKFKSKLIQVARSNSASHIATDADTQMFLKMAMHTADVSNPAKPWIYARHWAELIAEEFYNQGDRERGLGLTISAFMDRNKPNLPKLQLSFINFIVAPLFEEWGVAVEDVKTHCLLHLEVNKRYWSRQQKLRDAAMTAADGEANRRRNSVRSDASYASATSQSSQPRGRRTRRTSGGPATNERRGSGGGGKGSGVGVGVGAGVGSDGGEGKGVTQGRVRSMAGVKRRVVKKGSGSARNLLAQPTLQQGSSMTIAASTRRNGDPHQQQQERGGRGEDAADHPSSTVSTVSASSGSSGNSSEAAHTQPHVHGGGAPVSVVVEPAVAEEAPRYSLAASGRSIPSSRNSSSSSPLTASGAGAGAGAGATVSPVRAGGRVMYGSPGRV